MIFQKPNIKYTQMCIYIDENIYKDVKDEEKIFQYLFHIFYMLSNKNKLFQVKQDYEEFSLYAASCTMMRYKNPKQLDGRVKKIKSILNWAKKALYGLSVNYRKKQSQEVLSVENIGEEGLNNINKNLYLKAINPEMQFLDIEIQEYFKYIPRTIKNMIKDSPYMNRQQDLHNIYISTLLSFISSITFSNFNIKKIQNLSNKGSYIFTLLDNLYQEESLSPPILIHLPQHMSNYIKFLVNKIRKIISKDLAYLSNMHNISENTLQDILKPTLDILGANND